MTTLREFVEGCADSISQVFEKTGQVSPMYHFVCPKGSAIMPAVSGDKDTSVAIARMILGQVGATRVVLIDEAWMLETRSKEEGERANETGLEHHPKRTEHILLMAEDASEGVLMATRKIDRTDGRATLEPLVFSDMTVFSGRMASLLPTKGRGN
jgi:hypothetical protein